MPGIDEEIVEQSPESGPLPNTDVGQNTEHPTSSTVHSEEEPQLLKGKGGVQYAIVAVDYFTKWTEVEPLEPITSKKVLDFVVKNILCIFALPQKIVSDNDTQFDNQLFTDFYAKHNITKRFSAVSHPQANG
ncbi:uncharacterized protein LOC133796000 [Humulus lupulus]|uniref:uncharacterized protein LOC133796000 n=1 Tax=Humulus lupulus TaxID=3486 RepID=UPI002B4108D9|nr:uncharacterized protein LOC133796000 [Humulus lupulus]